MTYKKRLKKLNIFSIEKEELTAIDTYLIRGYIGDRALFSDVHSNRMRGNRLKHREFQLGIREKKYEGS